MTLINLHYYQEIATKPIIITQDLTREEQREETNLPEIPSKKEEGHFTNRLEGEEKEIATTLPEDIKTLPFISSFSDSYIAYNTEALVNQLVKELSAWEKTGTEEGLIHISNIKDLLEEHQQYLHQKPENRILISLFQLIFENNSWESLTTSQIRQLKNELSRFREGKVDWKRLEAFSKQMYRGKTLPLKSKSNNDQKEKKETD